MITINYDKNLYDFVLEIEKLYCISDLSEVHTEWADSKEYELLDKIILDQKTVYHKKFYDDAMEKTNFYNVYHSFITDIIRPLFDEDILYQRIPTFRVHQPDNLSVADFHRDKDYNHSIHETNFYLPLTRAWGTNTIWHETEYNKKDFQPIEANVGEVVMWNGSSLLHGNKINNTGKSRVSVDFRVLPVSRYENTGKKSLANETVMNIGGYWI